MTNDIDRKAFEAWAIREWGFSRSDLLKDADGKYYKAAVRCAKSAWLNGATHERKNWICERCKAQYIEYINGCPRCENGETGGSAKVVTLNEYLAARDHYRQQVQELVEAVEEFIAANNDLATRHSGGDEEFVDEDIDLILNAVAAKERVAQAIGAVKKEAGR